MMTETEITAYHEIGHALAMYLCSGNIDRIERIKVRPSGGGSTEHTEGGSVSFVPAFPDREGLTALFDEVCYSLGGMVAERMFTDNTEEAIEAGASGDIRKAETYMRGYGLTDKKEMKALERLATSFLSRAFITHGLKVRELASQLAEKGEIERIDFYRIFDRKLYRREKRILTSTLNMNVE